VKLQIPNPKLQKEKYKIPNLKRENLRCDIKAKLQIPNPKLQINTKFQANQ
jgi:hypothetical protein